MSYGSELSKIALDKIESTVKAEVERAKENIHSTFKKAAEAGQLSTEWSFTVKSFRSPEAQNYFLDFITNHVNQLGFTTVQWKSYTVHYPHYGYAYNLDEIVKKATLFNNQIRFIAKWDPGMIKKDWSQDFFSTSQKGETCSITQQGRSGVVSRVVEACGLAQKAESIAASRVESYDTAEDLKGQLNKIQDRLKSVEAHLAAQCEASLVASALEGKVAALVQSTLEPLISSCTELIRQMKSSNETAKPILRASPDDQGDENWFEACEEEAQLHAFSIAPKQKDVELATLKMALRHKDELHEKDMQLQLANLSLQHKEIVFELQQANAMLKQVHHDRTYNEHATYFLQHTEHTKKPDPACSNTSSLGRVTPVSDTGSYEMVDLSQTYGIEALGFQDTNDVVDICSESEDESSSSGQSRKSKFSCASAPVESACPQCFLPRTRFLRPNGNHVTAAELLSNGGDIVLGPQGCVTVTSAMKHPTEDRRLVSIYTEEDGNFTVTADHRVMVEGSDGEQQPMAVGRLELLRPTSRPRIFDGSKFQAIRCIELVWKNTSVVEVAFADDAIVMAWMLPARRPHQGMKRSLKPNTAIACRGAPNEDCNLKVQNTFLHCPKSERVLPRSLSEGAWPRGALFSIGTRFHMEQAPHACRVCQAQHRHYLDPTKPPCKHGMECLSCHMPHLEQGRRLAR